jgi:hypothetical protein
LLYYPKLYRDIYNDYKIDNLNNYYWDNENIYKSNYSYIKERTIINQKYFEYLRNLTLKEQEILQNIFNYKE